MIIIQTKNHSIHVRFALDNSNFVLKRFSPNDCIDYTLWQLKDSPCVLIKTQEFIKAMQEKKIKGFDKGLEDVMEMNKQLGDAEHFIVDIYDDEMLMVINKVSESNNPETLTTLLTLVKKTDRATIYQIKQPSIYQGIKIWGFITVLLCLVYAVKIYG